MIQMHVPSAEGYTATDISARYKRMKGFNVLHPIAWDAFGLPAEQFALQTGTHPAETTKKNIDRFREQLQSLGTLPTVAWGTPSCSAVACDSSSINFTVHSLPTFHAKQQSAVSRTICPGLVLRGHKRIDCRPVVRLGQGVFHHRP